MGKRGTVRGFNFMHILRFFRMSMRVIAVLFFCIFSSNTAFGQNFNISVFVDSSHVMDVAKVKETLLMQPEKFLPSQEIHRGLKAGCAYWLYIQFQNTDSLAEYVLSFRRWVSTMEVYPYPYVSASGFGGRMVPYNQKEFPDCSVSLKSGCSGYLLKVENNMGTVVSLRNMEIRTALSFQKWHEKRNFLQGFIQGLFWLMLLYNLMLFVVIRRRLFLHYVAYTLFNSLYFLFVFGHSEVLFFPDNYRLNLILYTFQIIGVFPYFMFLRKTLMNHCPAYTPEIDRKFFRPFFYTLLVSNLLIACTILVHINFYNIAFNVSNMVSVLIGISILIYYYRKSDDIMHIIFNGASIMVAFGIIDILYVPLNLPVDNLFFETGVTIELMFFAYAMSKEHSIDIVKRYQAEVEKQQLQGELDAKNRELVYQTIQLSAKEEALALVKDKIVTMKMDHEEKKQVLSNLEVNHSLNNNLWKEFELHFNETNPGFYEALMKKYPALTSNEMRLCAFLRLSLNTKEIAAITQKSVHSIEMMRSRIRQKMQLDRDANLFFILTQL